MASLFDGIEHKNDILRKEQLSKAKKTVLISSWEALLHGIIALNLRNQKFIDQRSRWLKGKSNLLIKN